MGKKYQKQRLVLEGFLVLFFQDLFIFILYAWVFFSCMFVYVHGGQKRISDLMELELQTVASCPAVAGS